MERGLDVTRMIEPAADASAGCVDMSADYTFDAEKIMRKETGDPNWTMTPECRDRHKNDKCRVFFGGGGASVYPFSCSNCGTTSSTSYCWCAGRIHYVCSKCRGGIW